MNEHNLPRIVFVVSLAILWWNAAPSVTFHDSGELALAAASAGIPHPPGMPTWTALASAFVRLGGFDDPARGTNLFSGLCAAGSLAVLSLLILHWTQRLWPGAKPGAGIMGAILGPLVLMHSPSFLEQSFVTEQYTLQVFFIALMMWVGSRLTVSEAVHGVTGRPESNPRRTGGMLLALGALWGLAIGNHLSQLALGLFVGWVVLIRAGWPLRFSELMRVGFPVVAGLIAGLLVFLWLPLRSAHDPVMDWSNARTWDNFVFAITRAQYPTRPIASAPAGYVREWMRTYDFPGQFGLLGLALVVVGLFVIARKGRMLLGWLLAVSIPYAAGMLIGHMGEQGKNIGYIRHYGVSDWHLPVYFAGAHAAGVAFADVISWVRSRRGARSAFFAGALVLGVCGAVSARAVGFCSLRNFSAPGQYIQNLLAPLPEDAIVAVLGDNAAGMLTYARYGSHNGAGRFVVFALRPLPRLIHEVIEQGGTWDETRKVAYLRTLMMEPRFQPIRVAPMDPARAVRGRVFVDYVSSYPNSFPYLRPRGLLFEVTLEKASPDEIRQIEAENHLKFPGLFTPPTHEPNRLEAEAYADLHQDRGIYLGGLGLWPEAAVALELSLAWVGTNGEVWQRLGMVRTQLGLVMKAAEAYEKAIAFAPMLPESRNNLGILLASHGQFDAAIALLEDEVRLFPENSNARINLERARRDREQKGRNIRNENE